MESYSIKVDIALEAMKMHTCIVSLRIDESGLKNAQALFEAFRRDLNGWSSRLKIAAGPIHSYEAHVALLNRPSDCHAPLEVFCSLWNADVVLASIPAKVTIKLIYRSATLLACTNSIGLPMLSKGIGPMRIFDEEAELAALTQALEAEIKQSKAAQRAAPVTDPVELPKDIRTRIAAYLRLEYGESARDKASIKARDLVLEGEFVIDGVPTQFWRYPSKSPSWATVERFADHYCLGMGESHPEHKNASRDASVTGSGLLDGDKPSLPIWDFSSKSASELKRNGIWVDKETWNPLWILVEKDFEINDRILPIAWQVELEVVRTVCSN
jgi:hypothetical protein